MEIADSGKLSLQQDIEHIVILVTCAKEEEADRIATEIVTEKLAACINVIPRIRSYYIWEGKLQKDEEYLLLIKSLPGKVKKLEETIQRLHSYDIPEFIILPLIGGSEKYLGWMEEIRA